MDTLFYKVLHNKAIFDNIIKQLKSNYDNSTIIENKHSCKFLIENGFKKTLKYKIMNNHYLVLDNLAITKFEEENQKQPTYQTQTQTQTETKTNKEKKKEKENETKTMIKEFKEINENKEEFEIIFKFLNDETIKEEESNEEKEEIEFYKSLLNRYLDKLIVKEDIIQSSILSNNKISFQTICKELKYKPTNKDLFKSIYFKKFNISKWIISNNHMNKNENVWKYLFKSINKKTIKSSIEFNEYFQFIEFLVSKDIKSFKIPTDLKDSKFKKEIIVNWFRVVDPIKLNLKLSVLIDLLLLVHCFELVKLTFPATNGILSSKQIQSLQFSSKHLETGLKELDTTDSSLNKVNTILEFYYLVSSGTTYFRMYDDDDDSIEISPRKPLSYYCKFGFKKQDLSEYKGSSLISNGVSILDSLMCCNNDLLSMQIKYITDSVPETNPNKMLLELLYSSHGRSGGNKQQQQQNHDKFLLFKYCHSAALKKGFINKLIKTPFDDWVIFCLLVETDDLELIKFAFEKFKIGKTYGVSAAASSKTLKKQKVSKDSSQVTSQDQVEQQTDPGIEKYGTIFYQAFTNIYSFVKSSKVLEFIFNSNLTKGGANLLKPELFQDNLELLSTCENLLLSKLNHGDKHIRVNAIKNDDEGVSIKDMKFTSYFIKKSNIYKIDDTTSSDDESTPTPIAYIYLSGEKEYKYTNSDIEEFKFVIQNYPNPKNKKFSFSLPNPLFPDFRITDLDLQLFKEVLVNLDKLDTSKLGLNLLNYCNSGGELSALDISDVNNLTLVFTMASLNGDLNFINSYLSNNSKQQQQDSSIIEITSFLLKESLRYGNLQVLKLINEKYPQLILPDLFLYKQDDLDCILKNCLKFNYLEIIEYLLEKKLVDSNELLKIINPTSKYFNSISKSTILLINKMITK